MGALEPSKGKQAVGGCLVLILIIFVGVILVTALFGHTSSNSPTVSVRSEQPPAPAPIIEVSAGELFRAYRRNEVSADTIYKGHALRIKGRVTSINKDFTDEIYVLLDTSNMFENVHAALNSDETATAATLTKGDAITLLCTGEGMVIGSPIVKDCSISSSTRH